MLLFLTLSIFWEELKLIGLKRCRINVYEHSHKYTQIFLLQFFRHNMMIEHSFKYFYIIVFFGKFKM